MFVCRSGVGKTAFGCNVAVNIGRDYPVMFVSIEMHARMILQRCASIYAQTPTSRVEHQVTEEGSSPAIEAFVKAYPLLSIVDEPGVALNQFGLLFEEYEEIHGARPRLVIVDYLELVSGGMSMSDSGQMDKLARGIRAVARREDLSMLVLHQTNTGGGEGHKPLTRGDIRYGADVPFDYTLAAFRPCLDPTLSWDEAEGMKSDFRIQFLKTRTSGGLAPHGVSHYYDVASTEIRRPGPMLLPEWQEPGPWIEDEEYTA